MHISVLTGSVTKFPVTKFPTTKLPSYKVPNYKVPSYKAPKLQYSHVINPELQNSQWLHNFFLAATKFPDSFPDFPGRSINHSTDACTVQ